jgi:signal transduction histidine kinase
VLLIGWGAVLAEVAGERRDAENAAVVRSQDRAALLHQHVVKTLQVAALTSLHLGQSYLLADPERRLSPGRIGRIDNPAIRIAGVAGVAIVDHDGKLIAEAGPVILPEHLRRASATNVERSGGEGLKISDPVSIGSSGKKYVLVTSKVLKGDKLAGFVILVFRPEQFLNFPLPTKFDKTDLVSVINLNGITLARREGDLFSSGENVRSRLVMRKQQENPNGTYLGPSSLDGVVRYFSHRRLSQFPLFVTAGVSHSAAISAAHRRTIGYFGVMGAMSAFGLFMAWAVQKEAVNRKRKAIELAESMRRLQEAQRVGKIGDWEYDLETGVVIWSNQLCEMYERSPQDDVLTLEQFSRYLAPASREKFQQDVNTLLSEGGTHSYEFQVILPSGAVSYRRSNAVASVSPDGKINRLYGTDQDVTSSHQIRELEKQVAHLDRQGAMSMMAGTLAHELNQPLTAASNYVTGALRSVRHANELQHSSVVGGLRGALHQIHDAAEIIRRVRRMVQPEADTSRTASVGAVVADSVALLQASGFHAAEAICIEVADGLPDAVIAPIQLQQVLVNLLRNALEAVPSTGAVVSLTASELAEGLLRIAVRDNGPGFKAGDDLISSGFRSAKKSGLGLGLSISRTITEYHGGKLLVEFSQPGNTVIAILLRAARA